MSLLSRKSPTEEAVIRWQWIRAQLLLISVPLLIGMCYVLYFSANAPSPLLTIILSVVAIIGGPLPFAMAQILDDNEDYLSSSSIAGRIIWGAGMCGYVGLFLICAVATPFALFVADHDALSLFVALATAAGMYGMYWFFKFLLEPRLQGHLDSLFKATWEAREKERLLNKLNFLVQQQVLGLSRQRQNTIRRQVEAMNLEAMERRINQVEAIFKFAGEANKLFPELYRNGKSEDAYKIVNNLLDMTPNKCGKAIRGMVTLLANRHLNTVVNEATEGTPLQGRLPGVDDLSEFTAQTQPA